MKKSIKVKGHVWMEALLIFDGCVHTDHFLEGSDSVSSGSFLRIIILILEYEHLFVRVPWKTFLGSFRIKVFAAFFWHGL